MILIIFATFAILVIISLYQKNTNGICKSKKRLEGKVAVVTGGTAGMGLEIATDFAHRGAKVIIACPIEEEGVMARKKIIETTGNEKVIFRLLDLASLISIRKFVEDTLKETDRLDILVNNAGVGVPNNPETYNCTNFIMHVNYIGHFLLTILLLPILKKTGTISEPSRIVNTASIIHLIGKVNLAHKNRGDLPYRILCYSNSKYCCVLIGHVLSKKLRGSNVVINTVDPGAVGTEIFKNLWGGFIITFLAKILFKTPWEGAQTALHVALDDESGRVTGQFFKNCKLSRAKGSAYDDNLGNELWEASVNIVKLGSDELNTIIPK